MGDTGFFSFREDLLYLLSTGDHLNIVRDPADFRLGFWSL